MATLYWGPSGGTSTGSWTGASATNWFTDAGRTTPSGAAPTSADDVVFDADSDNGAPFTVTVGSGAICKSVTVSGLDQTMTLAGSSTLTVHGSLAFPATNFTRTFTGGVTFTAITTGNTITVSYTGNQLTTGAITFNGANGEWTLGSNLAYGTSGDQAITLTAGTLKTANYTMTGGGIIVPISALATRMELGSSTINISPSGGQFQVLSANFTVDAGTSTIDFKSFNCRFSGGGLTYYNVLFTDNSVVSNQQITGANTFNNVSVGSRPLNTVSGLILSADQIINGTLTLGSANTPVRRLFVRSNTFGAQRTITLNGTLASTNDVDFRDIKVEGTFGTWSGTRLGNCGGNSGITFDAPKTVYFVGTTNANWSATTWALGSGGATSVNNFPLAQDTAVIDNSSLNTGATLTMDSNYNMSGIDFSVRSSAITFAFGANAPFMYGDFILSASVTLTGTATMTLCKRSGTQTFTSAGQTFDRPLTIDNSGGIVAFSDAFTHAATRTFTFTNGTVQFAAGATSTFAVLSISGSSQKFLQSTSAGSQATISLASGTQNIQNVTAKDIAATGGARWNLVNGSISQGNLSGWYVGHQQNAFLPGGIF